jgi:hypothetical protein
VRVGGAAVSRTGRGRRAATAGRGKVTRAEAAPTLGLGVAVGDRMACGETVEAMTLHLGEEFWKVLFAVARRARLEVMSCQPCSPTSELCGAGAGRGATDLTGNLSRASLRSQVRSILRCASGKRRNKYFTFMDSNTAAPAAAVNPL